MIKLNRRQLPEALRRRLDKRVASLHLCFQSNQNPPKALVNFYRNPKIKAHLVAEAHGKCVYCESKISHVYYGDVEHIKPKVHCREELLDIENLALSCAQCNNAKSDYWDAGMPLLNPYMDEPQQELLSLGSLIVRKPGRVRARPTIDRLMLNRAALVERRKERIELLQNLADQYVQAPSGSLKDLLRDELCRQASDGSEYAMTVRAYIRAACDLAC